MINSSVRAIIQLILLVLVLPIYLTVGVLVCALVWIFLAILIIWVPFLVTAEILRLLYLNVINPKGTI